MEGVLIVVVTRAHLKNVVRLEHFSREDAKFAKNNLFSIFFAVPLSESRF